MNLCLVLICRRSTCDAAAGTACDTTSTNEDKTPPGFAGMRAVKTCDVSCCWRLLFSHRKIPKISPGAYIFQRPFLRGLFLEGLIFGGAYVRSENCVSKWIGLACSGKEIYHFCFVLLCIRGQIPSLYSEGRFNGRFFALRIWGAYIWRALYMEGLIFGILRYPNGIAGRSGSYVASS